MKLSRSPRTLIHIGYHKTGSSWLQQQLFIRGRAPFAPLSKNPRGSSTLAWNFILNDEGYVLSPYDDNTEEITRHYGEIERSNPVLYPVELLSWERLSGGPNSGGEDTRSIARRLHRAFPNAQVLIVIRRQQDWILSNYFEYLTAGGTHSLTKYLRFTDDGERSGFNPERLKYHLLVTDYQERFGAEKVLVLTYEDFRDNKEGFLNDLSSFIGFPIAKDQLDLTAKINAKANHYTAYHFRWLNWLNHSSSLNSYSPLSNRLTRRLGKWTIGCISKLIPDSLNKRLLEALRNKVEIYCEGRYGHSNQVLEKLIDRDLKKLGYDVDRF
ncbi:sulfotransferase domain-containing protein [Lewinella sp. 4G2]|uniref:sulfotransferase domain-containing protein n=1 Tax=Lewinella sp. 4G2 TaxID=1803372 RepID=UPI0007B4C55F|nr:sulfotransferase domain-containing protein [Lewinella sp. 4G2]OAV46191.1 hypothetical protein A3850_018200 [Lewinella sp. 4G2]